MRDFLVLTGVWLSAVPTLQPANARTEVIPGRDALAVGANGRTVIVRAGNRVQ